jgi:hypothetical protein
MSAAEFSGIGFAPGVVTGVRSFDVDKLGRLTGVSHRQVWKPGENVAECRRQDDPYSAAIAQILNEYTWQRGGRVFGKSRPTVSPAPAVDYSKPHDMEKCTHGFYAYYDGSNDYHDKGRVSAVIEGYGETVIGTRGFRAMKARIVALRINKEVPEHLALLVRRNYASVPFFDSFKAMVSEFPPDDGGAGVTPDSDPDFWTRSI